uniref:Obscurin like cytoskeletal adaptor 1b n=1 Tax=Sinocyclocheilus rhinocerous TaxID=307959 RepID=A0A673J7F9_9TELE
AAATLKVEGEAQEMEFREENKPRFLIKPLSTRVGRGEDAVFSCKLWGNPRPEVMWEKDGKKLNEIFESTHFAISYQDGGWFQLKIFKTRAPDGGVYTCKARNEFGESLAGAVLEAKTLNDLQVWERDLAVLECEVPEDSVPITWYLEDRRLQPGAKYGMEEWGTKRRLTIRDIGVDDDGIYLCEMVDGGRSIAEVAVKGTIVRKLPRKVDVLEGENAAFCVEVEEEEMDIHWYKDGTELRETHQTILKSFGRTHILVFVNTTPQDSGLVMFYVGRSKTSSQLRVKAARHCPPSCPIGVQINTERANAALLSWFPAQDSRKNPPSGYIIERQEVGSQEWLQCLTTDSVTSVEILGDSVPCEADYRFRICSVNKYGRSGNVEFPRAVHLGKLLIKAIQLIHIKKALTNLIPNSTVLLAKLTWFLNGNQLQDDERFSIRRSRTHQSLRIRGVRDTDNGAEITFIAYGIRDSAALYIQAPPVRFLVLPEDERNKSIEAGSPIALRCELSDPLAQVSWYKDGVKLLPQSGLDFKSKGTERQMIVQIAEFYHSGVYSCKTRGDAVHFNVDVKAPPVMFSAVPEIEKNKSVEAGWPIILQCEISDPTALVQWYKDGLQLLPQSGVYIQSQHTMRTLVIQSANVSHSGFYSCNTADDISEFFVDVKGDIQYPNYNLLLCCQVSRSDATAQWYKDGVELKPCDNVLIEAENTIRRLIILSAQLSDSGTYTCRAGNSALIFKVNVREPPVMIVYPKEDVHLDRYTSERMVLSCEISRPNATVRWYRDGLEVEESDSLILEVDGVYRRLIIPKPTVKDSAEYVCDTADDSVTFFVNIAGPPVRFIRPRKMAYGVEKLVGDTVDLECEVSRPNAEVSWKKDGVEIEENSNITITEDGTSRQLTIHSAAFEDAGQYVCDARDDVMDFLVKIKETKCRFVASDAIVLKCEISRANGEVSWLKDNEKIEGNEHLICEEEGTFRSLIVLSAELKDSGEYICDAQDDKVRPGNGANFLFFLSQVPRIVEFIAELHNITVMEGEDATFKCVVSPEDAKLAWFRNGQPISSNEKFNISSNGLCHMLHITNCQVSDSCKLTAEAEGVISRAILQVQEAQVLFTKSMGPVVAEEFGEATLEVAVSHETAEVRWMRQGVVIHPGSKFTLKQNGKKRSLTIHKLTLSDRGTYSCETLHDRTQAKLTVEPRKIKIRKGLTEIQTYEQETASFEVELSHSNVEGVWQKDGHILKNNNRLRMTAKGRVHSLTISNLTLDDTGTYIFSVDNIRSIARLDVKGLYLFFLPFSLPANIVKPLQDKTALEKTCVILDCTVTNPRCSIRWYKGPNVILPSERFEICSEGCYRKLVIQQVLLEDEGTYSVQVGNYTSSAKLTVEGKANSVLSNQL